MIEQGTREQRRLAKKWEREAIATGRWRPWESMPIPLDWGNYSGWVREVTRVERNWLYVVLIRPVATAWGEVHHLAIRTPSSLEPPWRDKQRIKDDLFGPEFTAVEVMPPQGELIDEADMYHMWVMPAEFMLPFTIARRAA